MKRLLLFLFVLASVQSFGQLVQFPTNYGVGYRRTGADTLLWIPKDTFSVPASLLSRTHLASKAGTLYYWTGASWAALAGGSGITNIATGYGLSGGPITITGTIIVDSSALAAYFLRRKDSLTGTNLNGYLTRSSLPTYYPGIDDVLAVGQAIGTSRATNINGGSWNIWNSPTSQFSDGYFWLRGIGTKNVNLQAYLGTDASDNQGYLNWSNTVGFTAEWQNNGAFFKRSKVWATTTFAGLDYQDDTNESVGDLTISKNFGEMSHNLNVFLGSDQSTQYVNLDFVNHVNTFGNTATQSYLESRVDSLTLALKTTSSKLLINNLATGGSVLDSLTAINSGGQVKKINTGLFTLQRDTIALASFGAGSTAAGDTAAFSTTALYGSFYNSGSDTLVITSFQVGLQGTSPSILVKVYYNDSLNVTAGATTLVTAGNTCTNIYTGTSVTSLNNTKIPPGNWVWVSTPTVTTKPTYFTLTLLGYKSRR